MNQHPLAVRRSQMAAAVNTTESLGKAVGSLGHVVAKREERTYLEILNPRQVTGYQAWLEKNRDRVRRRAASRHGGADQAAPFASLSLAEAAATTTASDSAGAAVSSVSTGSSNEVSLHDICRRLNEVLQISTRNDPNHQMSV